MRYEDERLRPTPTCHAAAWFFRRLIGGEDWWLFVRRDPCSYCGTRGRTRTRDHIHPMSAGGKRYWHNVAPACSDCQRAKGADPLVYFLRTRQRIGRQVNRRREPWGHAIRRLLR